MSETLRALYTLAASQAGYFTTSQAHDAGVSRRALSGRARTGDVEQVRYGIYRLRQFPAQPFEDVVAACLWVGPGSTASHETALAIHGISDAMPTVIHVTVSFPFRGRRIGVMVHHGALRDAEREFLGDVPVTTLSRTLLDVATSSDPVLVKQAVGQAVARRALSRRQLRRMVRDSPELAPLVVDALMEEE